MIDKSLIDKNWEEHYVKKGDPNKPTYYIVRRRWLGTGLFSNFIVFAGHIRYALSQGWLPVVDMQNYPNPYLAPEKLGKENAWEYYFEQPLRISLEEAYNGENVILCSEKISFPTNIFEDSKSLTEWKKLVKKDLLKVKPALMKEIFAIREKLFAPNDRVLGVLLRGTDYVVNKPKWHPIPPPVEYARNVILEKIRAWKCNKIFLVTEDKSIIQFFKETFGDGFGNFCMILNREYVDYKPGQLISNVRIERENDYFLQGKEYLTQIVLLSMCNSLITARTSGSIAVMMLANNFENVYAFDLGRYGVFPVDWRKLIAQ